MSYNLKCFLNKHVLTRYFPSRATDDGLYLTCKTVFRSHSSNSLTLKSGPEFSASTVYIRSHEYSHATLIHRSQPFLQIVNNQFSKNTGTSLQHQFQANYQLNSVRSFSNKWKMRQDRNRSYAQALENMPDFKSLLREFYKLAHPDLIRAGNPTAADINDQSFQELNGVISTIKGSVEYPPAMIKTIQFHVVNRKDNTTNIVQLRLKTGGGDSKKQLARCFTEFFVNVGVLDRNISNFKWNDEFFPPYEGSKDGNYDDA